MIKQKKGEKVMKKQNLRNVSILILAVLFGVSSCFAAVTGGLPHAANKTAFVPGKTPVMYLGAVNAVAGYDGALTRATLNAQGSAVTLTPLAPVGSVLNGMQVTGLALTKNNFPVVSVTNDFRLHVVTTPEDGGTVISMPQINDAIGGVVDHNVVGVAASANTIFAAVPARGNNWEDAGADNRGIAIVRMNADNTTVTQDGNATALSAAAMADNVPGRHIAFYENAVVNHLGSALFDRAADMYWDDTLQRLYIGLSNVRRDNQNREGGVLGVLVGRFDAVGRLVLEPVVFNVTRAYLYYVGAGPSANLAECIVGTYFDGVHQVVLNDRYQNQGDEDVRVTIHKVRTMHTSTGKAYLIVASTVSFGAPMGGGGVGPGGIVLPPPAPRQPVQGIFALPLVTGKTGVDEVQNGKLAQVRFATGILLNNDPVNNITAMPRATTAPIFISDLDLAWFKDLFVVGDSVYICSAGAAPGAQGVFQATARFNANGAVIGWSRPTRVAGSHVQVQAAAVDAATGNFYALTGNPATTVAVTGWGNLPATLQTKIALNFPYETGGVHQVFSFDDNTPSFRANHFSLLALLGYDTVLLAKTSDADVPTTNYFDATEAAALVGVQTVKAWRGGDLTAIAPLVCADVMRTIYGGAPAPTTTGYLYIGGYNGVARLAHGGAGWDVDNGLAAMADLNAFTFTKLNNPDYHDVRKVVAVRDLNAAGGFVPADYLYVLTASKVIYSEADGVTNSESHDLTGIGTDMIILQRDNAHFNSALIGTTAGLYTTNFVAPFNYTQVAGVPGPVVQLVYISSTLGVDTCPGLLFVLTGDLIKNEGKVYVCNVAADGVLTVVPKTFDLGEFRANLVCAGGLMFTTMPKNFESTDFFKVYDPRAVAWKKVENEILSVDATNHTMVNAAAYDVALGSRVVPGDFGVKLNG